jgi:hypothetical protein
VKAAGRCCGQRALGAAVVAAFRAGFAGAVTGAGVVVVAVLVGAAVVVVVVRAGAAGPRGEAERTTVAA